MRFYKVIFLILLSASVPAISNEIPRCEDLDTPLGMEFEGEDFACKFSSDKHKFTIFRNGKIVIDDSYEVSIYIPEYFFLLWTIPYEMDGYIYFLNSGSDHDYSYTSIVKFDFESKKIIWEREVPIPASPNFLFTEDAIYYAGFKTIGKIDAKTGADLWMHTGLYNENPFLTFAFPRIEGGHVIFTEGMVQGLTSGEVPVRRKIIVNDKTGEIISKS